MSDTIRAVVDQRREKNGEERLICRITGEWFELEDWAANQMSIGIVNSINALAAEWDKALTGGVPARK